MLGKFFCYGYAKIYNEYYKTSHDIKYHKRTVKKYFKLFEKDFKNGFKTISTGISKYVYDNLPYTKPGFKFTLQNAQHVYARGLLFVDWNDLRRFCETNKLPS